MTTETAMLYYPNFQKGVWLEIALENGYIGVLSDFKRSLTFTVDTDTAVTYIKLHITQGHCLNGHMLMPKLVKNGTSTNLIPSTWKENYSSGYVNKKNLRFQRVSTFSYSAGLFVWPMVKQGSQYITNKVDPKGAEEDIDHFFVDSTSGLVLDQGTYTLSDHSQNNKNWDVVFGACKGNPNAFRPGNNCWPHLHNKMYFDAEGGMVWEKKTSDERYWVGYSTHAPIAIHKEDYTMVYEPHFNYTCKTKLTPESNPYTYQNVYWGPRQRIKLTKDFFVGTYWASGAPCALAWVSKDLKDWTVTELPRVVSNNYSPVNFVTCRQNNKLMFAGNSSAASFTSVRLMEIDDDGKVIDKGIKTLPENFRGPGNIAASFNNSYFGSILYVPQGSYLPYDDLDPSMKPFYGIDMDGEMFNSGLPRWVAGGSGGRTVSLSNIVNGHKEDAIWTTYSMRVEDVVIYHTHIITTTDGFKTRRDNGPFRMPGYTLYRVYDVPTHGIRASFYRTDTSNNNRVYDVYDRDGNVLEYAATVERKEGNSYIFDTPTFKIPLVGWNIEATAWKGRRGVDNDGFATWNWYPQKYDGGGIIYTEGNGPLAPDAVVAEINDSMYLSGHVLQALVPMDQIGRPVQTVDNKGVAYVVGAVENIGYIEEGMHRGKHFTTNLEWLV